MAGPVRLEDGRQIDDSIVGRDKHWTESFRAVDWDGNGLIDLIYNLAGSGEIYLLRNVGTKRAPLFAEPRQMACYGEPIAFTIRGPNAWPGDYNGDGKPDLLGCVDVECVSILRACGAGDGRAPALRNRRGAHARLRRNTHGIQTSV